MKILAFGEILFDCYPTARKIGGAPFNFCAHLAKLGEHAALCGAVGNDQLGEEALSFAKKYGVDTRYLAKHPVLPTGMCRVTYQDGEPCYDLSGTYAYDNVVLQEEILQKISEEFDVFYFGTLALRNEISKNTWEQLLQNGNFSLRFFDMNLRQTYYSDDLLKQGLLSCDMVKMNREEFLYIKKLASICSEDISSALAEICRTYQIKTAILTLDSEGACLWDEGQGFFSIPAKKTEFVSAVGAGDSFCACFLHHYLGGHSLQLCLEKAALLAGVVVSYEEAIPAYSPDFLKELRSFL